MTRKLFKKAVPGAFLILLILGLVLTGFCQEKKIVKIQTAGSLLVPFGAIEKAFEAENLDIDVLLEGHGSIQVIRHVIELPAFSGEPIADIVAVADYSLIPKLMYETMIPESNQPYADWCIQFGTNTLGLAYTSQSKYAEEIDADNWYQILARLEVKVGISDPRFDACGYRALMALKLAEYFYQEEDILNSVIGRFSYPIKVEENDGICTILIPEILEAERLAIRDSSIKLLFPIQSGDLDYGFEYKSVAQQHGVNFLEFPPEINLGSEKYKTLYPDMKVKLAFKRFASVNPDYDILPIIYGMTIPNNAPHPQEAVRLMKFILSPLGQEIMEETGQVIINPPVVDVLENLPQPLADIVIEK
jgi:molybdate/tungstate transport system substrate-binding protein